MKILNESSIDYTIPEMEVTGGGGWGWGKGDRTEIKAEIQPEAKSIAAFRKQSRRRKKRKSNPGVEFRRR